MAEGDDNELTDDDASRRLRGPLGRARDGAAQRLKSLSFNRIFPNLLTLIAACAGLPESALGMLRWTLEHMRQNLDAGLANQDSRAA